MRGQGLYTAGFVPSSSELTSSSQDAVPSGVGLLLTSSSMSDSGPSGLAVTVAGGVVFVTDSPLLSCSGPTDSPTDSPTSESPTDAPTDALTSSPTVGCCVETGRLACACVCVCVRMFD